MAARPARTRDGHRASRSPTPATPTPTSSTPRRASRKQVDPPINPDTGKPATSSAPAPRCCPTAACSSSAATSATRRRRTNQGLNTVFTFDPVTETWQTQRAHAPGPLVPDAARVADGRTLISAALPKTDDPDATTRLDMQINADVEIFSPDGTLQRLENFRARRAATGSRGRRCPGQYPHMCWMPSGHALVAGPRKTDTLALPPARARARTTRPGTTRPTCPTHRQWATGVLLPGTPRAARPGDALRRRRPRRPRPGAAASSSPPTASTITLRRRHAAAGWSAGPAMHVARAFANSVLLPDGKVGDRRRRLRRGPAPSSTTAGSYDGRPEAHRALRPGRPSALHARQRAGRGPHLPLDRAAAARRPRAVGGRRHQRPRRARTPAPRPTPPRSGRRRTCSTRTASRAARPRLDVARPRPSATASRSWPARRTTSRAPCSSRPARTPTTPT